VSELEALVAEAASLAVTLKEADLLATRLAEVTAWQDKARSVLQAGAVAPEAVLGVLVADGEATGLDLSPDLDHLQARAAARDWERRAKQVGSATKHGAHPLTTPSCSQVLDRELLCRQVHGSCPAA
jgi:hypothetical protein